MTQRHTRPGRYWIKVLICSGIMGLGVIGYSFRTLPTVMWFFLCGRNDARCVPYAISQLQSKYPEIRAAAAGGLGNIGQRSRSAIPNLIYTLGDESPEVASTAAWALGNILSGPQDIENKHINADAVQALIRSLDHSNGEVRRYSAYALSLCVPHGRAAIPALIKKLDDPQSASSAVSALGNYGNEGRIAIPQIAALMKSSNNGDRAESVIALSKLQPLPPEVVSAARLLLNDKDPLVRDCAQRAFKTIP